MKLEVGMYVRTKKGIAKIIGQVNDIENYWFGFWVTDRYLMINDDTEYIHEVDIIGEPSFNIIDLIEINDIIQIRESIDNYSKSYFIGINEMAMLLTIEERIEKNNLILESVLTHEQFENNCYKIGD